jgi:hypothetical protein
MTEVDEFVRRIASYGLRRRNEASPAPEVPDALWPSVLRSVAKQRITGIASAAAREEALLLTKGQRVELLDRHRSAIAVVLLLEDLLRRVSSGIASAEVPFVGSRPSGSTRLLSRSLEAYTTTEREEFSGRRPWVVEQLP